MLIAPMSGYDRIDFIHLSSGHMQLTNFFGVSLPLSCKLVQESAQGPKARFVLSVMATKFCHCSFIAVCM